MTKIIILMVMVSVWIMAILLVLMMEYSWVHMKTHPISLPPSSPPFTLVQVNVDVDDEFQLSWYEDPSSLHLPPSREFKWMLMSMLILMLMMMKFSWADMKTHPRILPPSPPFTRIQVNGAWCAGSLYPLLLRIHNVNNVERCTATMQPLSSHIVA